MSAHHDFWKEWIRQASKEPESDPVEDFAYAAGRRAGLEEAAKICEGEISGATEDASRDAALSHCIRQIRAALKIEGPK